MPSSFRIPARNVLLGCVVALAAGTLARADTVWTISDAPGAKPFLRDKVKIDGMQGDNLLFRGQSARSADPKPLSQVYRIQVDDEPVLNAAETSFAAGKWDDAIANYQRAVTTSRKDWVKQFATFRLVTAADKSGKFSAAATAYAALLARDPKAAEGVKPDVRPDKKAELPAAISAVKTALADTKLKPEQRNALQAFLAELYIANGQPREAEALGGKAGAPAGGTGTARTTRTPAAPAVNKGQLDLKLQLAAAALQQKKYQEAIDAIDSVAPSLTEPQQQAEALFTIAQAKEGLAGADAAKLKDAALAYMRVVAHFRDQPSAPRVPESLLRAGAVLEQAKLLPDALVAYEAVQAEYKDSPQSKDAAAAAARVRKALAAARG